MSDTTMQDPADLWDEKVREGLSPDEATAFVARIHGPPPSGSAGYGAVAQAEAQKRGVSPASLFPQGDGEGPGMLSRLKTAVAGALNPRTQFDVLKQTAHGSILGPASEAISAAVAAIPALAPGGEGFGDAYRANREEIDADLKQGAERLGGGAALGAQLVGGIASGALLPGGGVVSTGGKVLSAGERAAANLAAQADRAAVRQGARILSDATGRVAPTAGQIVREGAGIGAAYGAGASDAESPEGVLFDTALGAGEGAVGAGLTHGILKGAGGVARAPLPIRTVAGAGVGALGGAALDPNDPKAGAVRGAAIGSAVANTPAALKAALQSVAERGAAGLSSRAVTRGLAGAGLGAAGGAAQDPEHPVEGALTGALLGGGVAMAPEVLRGLRAMGETGAVGDLTSQGVPGLRRRPSTLNPERPMTIGGEFSVNPTRASSTERPSFSDLPAGGAGGDAVSMRLRPSTDAFTGEWRVMPEGSTRAGGRFRVFSPKEEGRQGLRWAEYDAEGNRIAQGKDFGVTPTDEELAQWDAEAKRIAALPEAPTREEPVFIRWGDLPAGGRSKNHATGASEAGVSVLPARFNRLTQQYEYGDDAILTDAHLSHLLNGSPAYLVSGRVVGRGSDGEPLLEGAQAIGRLEVGPKGFGLLTEGMAGDNVGVALRENPAPGQRGAAAPRALATLAGAGAGAAVGAATDEDPGSGALTGAAVGAGLANADRIGRALRSMGETGAVDVAGGTDALKRALQTARARLQPDLNEAANVRLLQRMEGKAPAADELQRIRDALTGTATPRALIDMSEGLRNEGRLARAISPVGREEIPQTLLQRMKEQGDRIRASLFRNTGLRREAASHTIEDLANLRQQEAQDLYGPLQDVEVSDPRINRLFQHRAFQKAYGEAQDIIDNENALRALRGEGPIPSLPSLEELTQGKPVPEGAPEGAAPELPPLTLGTLDRVKRGLDDVLGIGRRTGSIGNEKAGTLRDLKNGFLDTLDELVPEYRAARSAYAGRSALIDAAEEGKNFLKASQDEIDRLWSRYGDSEKEAYRKTALDALLGRADDVSDRHDLTKRRAFDLDVPSTREKLRFLFSDPAGQEQFTRDLAEEVQMAATNPHVLGGSQTAEKLVELANVFGVEPGDLLQSAGRGTSGLTDLLVKLGVAARNRVRQHTAGAVADAMTPKLLATGAERDRVLEELQETLRRLQESERRKGALRRAGAAGAASVASGG